jgi:hypothetical protein
LDIQVLVGLSGHTLKTGLARFLDDFQPESYRSAPPVAPPVPWKTTDRLAEEQVVELITRYGAGETSRELPACLRHQQDRSRAATARQRRRGPTARCATQRLSGLIITSLPSQVLRHGDHHSAEVRLRVHD